jgi:DNA-binding response OmpR family regulator
MAEDDPALASFVRKGLEAEHYAVDVTTDGEQARAMAGELDYDLLMLDLNLPRVDGITILRHLRTRKPSLPILVLTSRNRVEDRVQCLDLGADDYMGKPFSFAELSATRAMIIEHVWNLSFDTGTNVIDVYVNFGLRVTEVLSAPATSA